MAKTQDELLRALLEVDDKPERDVKMRRFGTFRIRALDDRELKSAREQAKFGKELDADLFACILIVKGCVAPDWSAKELLDKFQATDGADVVAKRLLPGERESLSAKILDLSGFSDDEAKEIEEIKN